MSNTNLSDVGEVAQNNADMIRQGFARTTLARLSELTGYEMEVLSRFEARGGELERYGWVLAAAGLKCVPVTARCFDSKQADTIIGLAKDRFNQVCTTEQLTWED